MGLLEYGAQWPLKQGGPLDDDTFTVAKFKIRSARASNIIYLI